MILTFGTLLMKIAHGGCATHNAQAQSYFYQSEPMTGPVAVVFEFHPCSMIFLSSSAFCERYRIYPSAPIVSGEGRMGCGDLSRLRGRFSGRKLAATSGTLPCDWSCFIVRLSLSRSKAVMLNAEGARDAAAAPRYCGKYP